MKIIGKHVLLQMALQHMKLIIVISKFHVHMYNYSCVETCQQLLSIKVHNVMMAHTCKYTVYLSYENTATIKYTANHHIHLGHLVSQFLCQTVCTQGQILYTRLRHRKIATRSLYQWHMPYTSYSATSPEPFQKLGQSLKVSRRVGNS